MKRFFILMTVLIALLTGCDPQTGTDAGNGGGTGSNTPSGGGNGGAAGTAAAELVSMDITDAESIYISTPTEAGETVSAKAGVTARTISERAAARGFTGSALFKITKEGKAVEISLTWGNEKNENTAQLQPLAVHETGTDYVIIEFYNPTIRQNIGYLINKKTGKAYSLEEVGVPQRYGDPVTYYPLIYTDGTGNIYYKTKLPYPRNGKNYDIVKIDVSDPSKPASKMMTLPQDYVEYAGFLSYLNEMLCFIVDKDGNLIYDAALTGVNSIPRLRFGDGGSISSPYTSDNCFIGLDGAIYVKEVDEGANKCNISLLELTSPDSVSKTFKCQVVNYINERPGGGATAHSGSRLLRVGKEMVSVHGCSFFVIYNEENMEQCRIVWFTFNIDANAATASETCYYISGRDENDGNKEKVVEVDLSSDTWREIAELAPYAVYQLSFANGVLTFGAVEQKTDRYVVGKYNPSTGDVTLVEGSSGSSVTYLTPIN